MTNRIFLEKEAIAIVENRQEKRDSTVFIYIFRIIIWVLGIPCWILGIGDRTLATLADGNISLPKLLQLVFASFLFISWLYLKPELTLENSHTPSTNYQLALPSEQIELYKNIVKNRVNELQDRHKIRQTHILPFPCLSQMYHLLNLKHLESIHGFSLNNLKVVKVSDFQLTNSGGILKFQTILDSPFNILRIWRQPIVEVDLTLHTPYTVELNIPVYNDKHITILFNAFPLSDREHLFSIDIYSNLNWPKSLLKAILHFASSLTLFEDLPYLNQLGDLNLTKISDRDTMQLHKRFVDLYGSSQAFCVIPLTHD
jgi:hypothetical protein